MSDTEDFSREAFMAAIMKLADDEAFRRSFLTHYQLWLHPPMMVTPGFDVSRFDLRPGHINFVTEEEMGSVYMLCASCGRIHGIDTGCEVIARAP